MLYDLRIRLRTPMLGADKSENTRRFKRGDSEEWISTGDVLPWAFNEAVSSAGLATSSVNTHGVRLPLQYKRPSLVLYRRNCRRGGQPSYDMYEAINKNSVLTMNLFVSETVEKGRQGSPITAAQVRSVLDIVGEHIGISPWGSKFGYGRFVVEAMDVADARGSLNEIRIKKYKLPVDFVQTHICRGDEVEIYGKPLDTLSRDELIAAAVFWHDNWHDNKLGSG